MGSYLASNFGWKLTDHTGECSLFFLLFAEALKTELEDFLIIYSLKKIC